MEQIKMNPSAESIGFVECRTAADQSIFVLQLPYPQCFFQVHEFTDTDHYMATLGQSDDWVHTQVGGRSMALTFNGCMMHYDFDQNNACERGQHLIDKLQEAAQWYDEFLNIKEK